jgi:hypothetical protein
VGVRELVRDFWLANTVVPESTANPAWEEVEIALRALDGEFRTEVDLVGAAGTFSGGGGPGGYVAIFTRSDTDESYTLRAGLPGEDPVELVVAGQLGLFARDSVIQLETMIMAARTFFDSEKLPTSMGWTRDPAGV